MRRLQSYIIHMLGLTLCLVANTLYQKNTNRPLRKCLSSDQVQPIFREYYKGFIGGHTRLLIVKSLEGTIEQHCTSMHSQIIKLVTPAKIP